MKRDGEVINDVLTYIFVKGFLILFDSLERCVDFLRT